MLTTRPPKPLLGGYAGEFLTGGGGEVSTNSIEDRGQ
jgi:hypothetical protein